MNKNLRNVLKAFMLLVCFSFFQNETNAQTFDNGIFFQALARDNYSNPAKDRKIFVQSTIIQSTINGTKVLVEEYQTTTDATGVFGISIGKGTRTGGSLSALNNIDWSAGPYFLNLKISITPVAPLESWNYSKDWVDLGTTSFGTVPYALYAKSVAGFDTKVNVSDTAKMLLPYAKAQALTLVQNAVNTKLNTADSVVKYVTPTQLANKKFDTTTLSNRIDLKANASDFLANTASIAANTNNISTITTNVAANTASITALSTVAKTGDFNDLTNKPTLSFPAATSNTLGGVIIGNNLTIDQNGVLSASSSNNANSLTGVVPVANGGTGTNSIIGIKSTVGLLGNTLAIGDQAGTFNQNSNTVALGAGAGNTNQGQSAIGIGYVAGYQNQGANSIAIGSNAAQGNQGQQAVAVGFAAGQNGQGDYAVALGSFAGNVQASNSIALNATGNSLNPSNAGFYVAPIRNLTNANNLFYNPTTNEITYGTSSSSGVPYTGANGAVNLGAYDLTVNGLTIGTGAGTSTSTSLYNTAVGFNALVTNTTGTYNSAFGRGSLRFNTTGNYNTALGLQSLNTNTTGTENTASGALSLFYNTTGNFNTAVGTRALFYNTTGTDNAAFGQLSSYLNQAGSYNTTIGTRSMFNNMYGNANTAVGWNSSALTGYGGTSSSSGGNNNTSLGYRALYANTLGNDNTAVGYNALQTNLTGTQNTTIGSGADVSSNALSNATAIGYGAIATTSNTMQLGNTNVTNVKTSGSITVGSGASSVAGTLVVGSTTPTGSSAALEVKSTSQGLLLPRLTTIQRDAIVSPEAGLLIYNTTLSKFQGYVSSSPIIASQTNSANNGYLSLGSFNMMGNISTTTGSQVFTVNGSNSISSIDVYFSGAGQAGNVTLTIYSGSTLGSGSNLGSTTLLINSTGAKSFVFASPVSVQAGSYYFVLTPALNTNLGLDYQNANFSGGSSYQNNNLLNNSSYRFVINGQSGTWSDLN